MKVWFDGKFIDEKKATVPLLTHSLHYGSAVFEGVRFYETEDGPAVFKLDEHLKRFFYSAKVLKIKIPYTQKELKKVTLDLIKKNKLKSGYVRPLAFYGAGMGLRIDGLPVHTAIAVWPWGKYHAGKVKVKTVSTMRIHPETTDVGAKISGHYANSIQAQIEAKKAGCGEGLLLDVKGNIAEGSAENVFFVKGKKIYTPDTYSILNGITRQTIIHIAKVLGYSVVEAKIKPSKIKTFDEAFFTGTAAEVSPIQSIDGHKFNQFSVGEEIGKMYFDIVHGRAKKYKKWLSYA